MGLTDRNVLYISYNGMLDPLGQSQVIPYLKELSKLGVKFTLLSFERAQAYTLDGRQRAQVIHEKLASFNIVWHTLRYHKRPSVPATAFDVAVGVRFASQLVRRNDIELVHARAHIPAAIALRLKSKFGLKTIFDLRGLMAEEYIDAGHWLADSLPARITKNMEARVLRTTDGLVTLTDALWNGMKDWPAISERQLVHETIPCCIDREVFRFDPAARRARRDELRINDRLVLVYSGSIGGWYMSTEMAAFFATLKRQRNDAFFLWLTTGSSQIVETAMRKAGVESSDYVIRSADVSQVPSYLSASDIGIAFYRPGVSRLGTSPVKVSEYLSCGLPIVINAGIGDSNSLVIAEQGGILVDSFEEDDYAKAMPGMLRLIADRDQAHKRARQVAERLFDLKTVGVARYARLYQRVLNQ
jgi:glycosyltransferase involved in cell wall biosynthesis